MQDMVVTVDPKKAARHNECLIPKIVHRADVKNLTNDEKKFYVRVTETPFKERFGNHTWDFKYTKYKNSTELLKYVLEPKDTHILPVIERSIPSVQSATKYEAYARKEPQQRNSTLVYVQT